jgi:RecA-family ATPase
MLLAPILPERSLAMLYAPRGMGKSLLALTIGLAVASGSAGTHRNRAGFFWSTMVLSDLQARLNLILAGLGTAIPNAGFRVVAVDHGERGINFKQQRRLART